MKRDAIKVGQKSGTKFVIAVNRPENEADCLKIVNGNSAKLAAFFYRGYCIWLQDAIGRPMFGEGATHEAIQKAVDVSDPNTTKARGKAPAPQVVKVDPKKKTFTGAEVEAMLKALKGVTIVTE